VNDGYPIIAKLATVDEETEQERRERKLDAERAEWAEAYENSVAPWRQSSDDVKDLEKNGKQQDICDDETKPP
jgi:hypothetical protein